MGLPSFGWFVRSEATQVLGSYKRSSRAIVSDRSTRGVTVTHGRGAIGVVFTFDSHISPVKGDVIHRTDGFTQLATSRPPIGRLFFSLLLAGKRLQSLLSLAGGPPLRRISCTKWLRHGLGHEISSTVPVVDPYLGLPGAIWYVSLNGSGSIHGSPWHTRSWDSSRSLIT